MEARNPPGSGLQIDFLGGSWHQGKAVLNPSLFVAAPD